MSPAIFHRINSHSHLRERFALSRSSSHERGELLTAAKPLEEETLPKYNPNAFYPMRLGETLNNRYNVVAKLGFGMTATVWLARDSRVATGSPGRKYVVIKISVNTLTEGFLQGRAEIAEKLSITNPHHPGYRHVRFMADKFKLKGPGGQHTCIVYDVLREPLGVCMEKFRGGLFSSDHLRILLPALLQGLDYMHSECGVVHTDLKPDNVMMGLGDATVLDKFVQEATDHPSPHKVAGADGRVIYKSRSNFGNAPTDAVISSAKIIDIGLAAWGDEHHNNPIQSNAFTAPEVILTAGWSYPADIWNLGVMLWDLFENFGLFDAIDTRPGHYKSEKHLGMMIALMGPPPKELLERGSTSATYFDENGEFRRQDWIPKDFSFESSISKFRGKDKELFIDFAKKMICWLPEERWTAKQLLGHPWLQEREPEEGLVHSISALSLEDMRDKILVRTETAKTTKSDSARTSANVTTSDGKNGSKSTYPESIQAILDR